MEAAEAFRLAGIVAYTALATIAATRWKRSGGRAAMWISLAFASLALVVTAGAVVPEEGGVAVEVASRVLILVLGAFPWLLYRFASTFDRPRPVERRIADVAGIALAASIVLLPELPESGEAWPAWYAAWVMAFLAWWVVLSGLVVVRLWRGGSGQPVLVRSRMRLLASGALLLTLALLASASIPGEPDGAAAATIQALALATAVLLYLGFAPPAWLRSFWRVEELKATNAATASLVGQQDLQQLEESFLPHLAHVVGGGGAAIVAEDGSVVASHEIDPATLARPGAARQRSDGMDDSLLLVPAGASTIVVRASRYTPFFGRDELQVVESLAGVVSLALERDRQVAELTRSRADLERFAYIASHDLQEPLRMVRGYCQLLQRRYEGQLDDDADEFIGFAVDGAERMQELINDLLDLSRASSRPREASPVELDRVLERVLHVLEPDIERTGGQVTAGELPCVEGDERLLQQLLQNLVGNALKFHGDAPPKVHVDAEDGTDECTVSVHDEGIGIADEHAQRVFEVFKRLHGRDQYEGTGIGLAICRRVVERHGGRIWVESEPGRGATFRFTVPHQGFHEEDDTA